MSRISVRLGGDPLECFYSCESARRRVLFCEFVESKECARNPAESVESPGEYAYENGHGLVLWT